MTFLRAFTILCFFSLTLLAFAQDGELDTFPGSDASIDSPSADLNTTTPTTETPPVTSEEILPSSSTNETTTEETTPPSEEKISDTPQGEENKTPPTAKPAEKNPSSGVVSDEEIAPIKAKTKNKKKDDSVSPDTYVQQNERYKLPDHYKSLDLNTAIEQGLRENGSEKIRNLKSDLIEINKQSAYTAFWLPNIQLQLSTEEQRLGRAWKGKKNGEGANASPTGTFGLSFGEYTIFNWGKDYLQYINKTAELKRNKENLYEERRTLRHKVISTYFELVTAKNVEKVMRNHLRQASFIFRLNKEKVSVGKATRQEYYESRAQYLKAQSDFQEAAVKVEVIEEALNNLINDPHGTSYITNQDILFQKVALPLDEALGIAKVKNANILNAKTKLEIAEHNYQLSAKELLPLPKISVNLGAYTNSFGKNGNVTTYQSRQNNSDVDIVATVNATWDIVGPRGLLNSKEREKAYLEKEISIHSLTQTKDDADSEVRDLYKRALFYEKQYILLEARSNNLQKNFDTLLDNYVNKRAYLNDLRRALDELVETQSLFEQTKLEHIRSKILLASQMGMEDLPGESFEKLVVGAKK